VTTMLYFCHSRMEDYVTLNYQFAVLLVLMSPLFILVGDALTPPRGRASLAVALSCFCGAQRVCSSRFNRSHEALNRRRRSTAWSVSITMRGVPCFRYRHYRLGIRCTL
jgi:hypothetical protein